MKKPLDPFQPPESDDPFNQGLRVVLVKCGECLREGQRRGSGHGVMGVLMVLPESTGQPQPTIDDLDHVMECAFWADSGYPDFCQHTDRLPAIASLRSRVARALRAGLDTLTAPVSMRV